ncbi:reverse transcriptase domain-containing protein [Pseudomonas sp. GG8]
MAKSDIDRWIKSRLLQDNIEAALDAVVRNKGAPGIDGITVKQLPGILSARWPEIEEQLLQGRYQPQSVRRVRIPNRRAGTQTSPLSAFRLSLRAECGRVRGSPGIPTVIDRLIQQAILLRLPPLWRALSRSELRAKRSKQFAHGARNATFSEHSYGFRPGRSAHQAVAQAQAYITEGYRFVVDFVVDIDLAKFFGRVNHDRLMAAVAARVADRRLLRLIWSYLTAGVFDNGLFADSREGTPQGGPLSPRASASRKLAPRSLSGGASSLIVRPKSSPLL